MLDYNARKTAKQKLFIGCRNDNRNIGLAATVTKKK